MAGLGEGGLLLRAPRLWYFSLAGGLALCIYAVHIKDPVFIVGQFCGLAVYLRNLMLLRKRPMRQR